MGDNLGPGVVTLIGFFLALSWLFVLLRFYCRAVLIRSFGLDDIFCLLAQSLYTVYCVFVLVMISYGMGQHVADIPPSNIPIALKWSLTSDPFYVFGNLALKLSIGIFLLRICVSKVHRVIIWSVMVISTIICVPFSLLAIFQCRPVSYFWEQVNPAAEGSCLSPSIIIDASIVPIFMIWKLQMHMQAKICVCLILGISSIASVITIIRIPTIASLNGTDDFLYDTTVLIKWGLCETGLALTACAAATLRPLIRLVTTKFDTHIPTDIAMHSSRGATQLDTWPSRTRYSRKDGMLDDDEVRIQTKITTHARGIDGDANHPSRWPEDDHSSNNDADRTSNSSQAKLKMDTETGLVVTTSPAGITKTVAVTTRSVRV